MEGSPESFDAIIRAEQVRRTEAAIETARLLKDQELLQVVARQKELQAQQENHDRAQLLQHDAALVARAAEGKLLFDANIGGTFRKTPGWIVWATINTEDNGSDGYGYMSWSYVSATILSASGRLNVARRVAAKNHEYPFKTRESFRAPLQRCKSMTEIDSVSDQELKDYRQQLAEFVLDRHLILG